MIVQRMCHVYELRVHAQIHRANDRFGKPVLQTRSVPFAARASRPPPREAPRPPGSGPRVFGGAAG